MDEIKKKVLDNSNVVLCQVAYISEHVWVHVIPTSQVTKLRQVQLK